MRWLKIKIHRAENGFVAEFTFTSGAIKTYVIEGNEERLMEVLTDVFAGKDTESSR